MSAIGVTERTISVGNGEFVRAGTPHRILAGSLHYFRLHPTQWPAGLLPFGSWA